MSRRASGQQTRGRITIARPFDPSQVAGLIALFDPVSANITIATGVSQWNDTSGNGHNLVQATGASQPTYNASDAAFNSQPTVQTNGSTFLATSSFTAALTGGISVFWVGLTSDIAGNAVVSTSTGTASPLLIANSAGAHNIAINNGASLDSGVLGTGAVAVVAMFHDGTDATHSYVAVSNWKTGGVTGGAGSSNGILTGIGVGGYTGGAFKAASKTAYLLFKQGLFTAGELSGLASYSARWGITVT